MQNHFLGTLHLYLDEDDPNQKVMYELVEGENFVGGSLFCDIKLPFANIADLHCKITLTSQGDYSIEDLSNASFGIYRATPKTLRQKLKSNKEYELLPDRPFYLTNKYKCIFRPKAYRGLTRSSSTLPAHDQEEEEILPSRNIPTRELVGSTGNTTSEEPVNWKEGGKGDKPVQIQRMKRYPRQVQSKQEVIVIKDTEESEEMKPETEKDNKKANLPVEQPKEEQNPQKDVQVHKEEKEVPIKETNISHEPKPEPKKKVEKEATENVHIPKEKVEVKPAKDISSKEIKTPAIETSAPPEKKDKSKAEEKTKKAVTPKPEPPPKIDEEKQSKEQTVKKAEKDPVIPLPEEKRKNSTEDLRKEMEPEKVERKKSQQLQPEPELEAKKHKDSIDELNFEEDIMVEEVTANNEEEKNEDKVKGPIEPVEPPKPTLPLEEPKKEPEYEIALPRYGDREKHKPTEKELERKAEKSKEHERKKDDHDTRTKSAREKEEKEYPKYDSQRREKGELDVKKQRDDIDDMDYKINRTRKDDKDQRREREDRERDQRPKEDKYLERKMSNSEDQNRYNRLPNYTKPYEPHGPANAPSHHNKLSIIKPSQIPPELKNDRSSRDKPMHRQWSNEKFEEDRKDRDPKIVMQPFPQYPQYPQYPQPQPPPPLREPRKNEREAFRDHEKGSRGKDDFRYDRDFDSYRKKSFNDNRDLHIDKAKNKTTLKPDNKIPDRGSGKLSFDEGESKPHDDPYSDKRRGTRPKSREKESLTDLEKNATSSKKPKLNEGKTASEGDHSGKASMTRNNISSEKEEAGEFIPERDQRLRPHYQIMFSGFDRDDREVEDSKKRLTQLGIKIVEERDKSFNVLVIKKFKRTIKFLLALNKGVDIVFFDWVKHCIKEDKALPPGDFICSDREAETKYKFRLSTSLQKARKKSHGFLKGYRVYFPADITPSLEEMKILVESAEGICLKAKPTQYREDILVILNVGDRRAASYFKDMGFMPHSSELIFSGILRQELNLQEHRM